MNPEASLHKYFSRRELLKDRDIEYPLSHELEKNLIRLITALNVVREKWNRPMQVSSGYRPGRYNTQAGGARNSCHLTCEAADIVDTQDKQLATYLSNNITLLEEAGLWMEHPSRTPGWVHLQTRAVRNRIFMP